MEAEVALMSIGWRVAMIWECAMRGRSTMATFDLAIDDLARWIRRQPEVLAFEVGLVDAPC